MNDKKTIPVERSAALGGGMHDPSDVYLGQDKRLKSHDPAVLVAGSQVNKGDEPRNQTTAGFSPEHGMFKGEHVGRGVVDSGTG